MRCIFKYKKCARLYSEGEKRDSVTVTCVKSKLDGSEALPHAGGARTRRTGARLRLALAGLARAGAARAHAARLLYQGFRVFRFVRGRGIMGTKSYLYVMLAHMGYGLNALMGRGRYGTRACTRAAL